MSDATGSVKDFLTWQKALYHDEILRKMAQKSEWDLRQTAIVMASFGQLGTGCFAAAGTVANLIGCHYNTIKRHRAELIRLGWFTPVGRNRRAVVLNISNPLADHIRVPLLANHPDGPLVGDHETAQSNHPDGPLPVVELLRSSIPGDGSPEEGSADAAPEPSFCHEEKNHAATPVSEADSPGPAGARRGDPYCYECRRGLIAGYTCPWTGFSHSEGCWGCRVCGKESVWMGFDYQGQSYHWCKNCDGEMPAAA